MAYQMTANELLINRGLQDIIDAAKRWNITTNVDTMRTDTHGAKLQNLKTDANARLVGAKKDYAIATIDGLWSAWGSWKDRGWKVVRDKTVAGLQGIQAVLGTSPDIVTNTVTQIVQGTVPAPIPVTAPTPATPVPTPAVGKVSFLSKKGWFNIPVWGWGLIIGVPAGAGIYYAIKKIKK